MMARYRQRRADYANLTWEPDGLVLSSSYDRGLVDALKAQVPSTERAWDGARKVWIVDPSHGQTVADLCKQYLGVDVSVPKGNPQANQTTTKILKVMYVGMTKDRGGGEQSAFGYVDGWWGVVFPEDVLIEWFQGDRAKVQSNQARAMMTLFEVLGIRQNVSPEEIKKAYRRMALQWHPDVCKEPDATERFQRINEAYEILSDDTKRRRYEAGLLLEKGLKNKDPIPAQLIAASYRAPLRCGIIIADGREVVGRFVVEKIRAWQDIVENGKTLVVSWPAGASMFEEQWV